MKKINNNREYFNDEFSKESRVQRRESCHKKNTLSQGKVADEDKGRRHIPRSEPAKNVVRVQLRQLENLF